MNPLPPPDRNYPAVDSKGSPRPSSRQMQPVGLSRCEQWSQTAALLAIRLIEGAYAMGSWANKLLESFSKEPQIRLCADRCLKALGSQVNPVDALRAWAQEMYQIHQLNIDGCSFVDYYQLHPILIRELSAIAQQSRSPIIQYILQELQERQTPILDALNHVKATGIPTDSD